MPGFTHLKNAQAVSLSHYLMAYVEMFIRDKKRFINIETDYYCFDVDDKYFFGFGMDYKGFYRNLQDIYYVE